LEGRGRPGRSDLGSLGAGPAGSAPLIRERRQARVRACWPG